MVKIGVITLFPPMFDAFIDYGTCRRAIDNAQLAVETYNPRDFVDDRHRTVDSRPYGGGPGMLMLPQPMAVCIDFVKQYNPGPVIYLSPQGERLDQHYLERLSASPALVLLAGRYRGIDERILQSRVDLEISIGDYVLAGGELAAMVLIEGLARLLPGVLGNSESVLRDSFSSGLLDHPHFTRPAVFEGKAVPPVLLGGNHEQIRLWRLQQALRRTRRRRPDLLDRLELDDEQIKLLKALDAKQYNEQDN